MGHPESGDTFAGTVPVRGLRHPLAESMDHMEIQTHGRASSSSGLKWVPRAALLEKERVSLSRGEDTTCK